MFLFGHIRGEKDLTVNTLLERYKAQGVSHMHVYSGSMQKPLRPVKELLHHCLTAAAVQSGYRGKEGTAALICLLLITFSRAAMHLTHTYPHADLYYLVSFHRCAVVSHADADCVQGASEGTCAYSGHVEGSDPRGAVGGGAAGAPVVPSQAGNIQGVHIWWLPSCAID